MIRQNAFSERYENKDGEKPITSSLTKLSKYNLLKRTLTHKGTTKRKLPNISSNLEEAKKNISGSKNKSETIQSFFRLNNPFIIPINSTNNTDKISFINNLLKRIKDNNLIIYDINQGSKGNLQNITLNQNQDSILYNYEKEPTNRRKIDIDYFINNIYYNNSDGREKILLSYQSIPIHSKEFSNKNDIYLEFKNINIFFENTVVSSMTYDSFLKFEKDLNYSIKKKTDMFYIISQLNKINNQTDKRKKLNEIINELKKNEIEKNADKLNQIDFEKFKNNVEITYNQIREEILKLLEEIDREMMPPPSKRKKIGGKGKKKMQRKVYIDDKGRKYIKYDKDTIIYLNF